MIVYEVFFFFLGEKICQFFYLEIIFLLKYLQSRLRLYKAQDIPKTKSHWSQIVLGRVQLETGSCSVVIYVSLALALREKTLIWLKQNSSIMF